MADAGAIKAGDRLPWLEPYRAPPKPRKARRLVGVATIAALAASAAAALLVVKDASFSTDRPAAPEASIALPAPVDMQPQIVLPPLERPVASATPAEARPVVRRAAPARHRKARRPTRKIVSAGIERDAFESLMTNQADTERPGQAPVQTVQPPPLIVQPAPPPAPLPMRPAVNPEAQVVRGKTVQLGVYYSARQAELAWRSAIKDYTFLVTMPKSIEPILIRSKRFYRLQLGTPSRKHARALCGNLRSTGRACTVA